MGTYLHLLGCGGGCRGDMFLAIRKREGEFAIKGAIKAAYGQVALIVLPFSADNFRVVTP